MERLFSVLSEALFSILLFSMPLFMDVSISSTFGVSKIVLMRVLSLAIATLWIFRLVYIKEKFVRTPLDRQIFIYTGITILAVVFSKSPALSFFGSYERQEGFITFANYIFLFYATVNLLEKESVLRILKVIVLAGVLSSIYGIMQHYEYDPFNLSWGAFSKDRVVSTFGNPVFFAAYTIMVLPIAFSLFLLENRRWLIMVYGVSIFTILLGFLFTNTRACYVGLLAEALLILTVFLFIRKNLPIKRLAILTLCGLIPFVGYNIKSGTSVICRFAEVFESRDEQRFTGSFGARLMMWKTGLLIVKSNPILGVGPEAIGITYPYYLYQTYTPDFPFEYEDRMHNEIFDTAVTRGLFGLFAYYWMVFSFFLFSIKRIAKAGFREKIVFLGILSGWLGYLVQNLFSFGLPSISSLFWIMMGLSILITKQRPKPRQCRRYYFLLLIIPIALSGLLLKNFYIADKFFRYSRYEEAIKLNPFCRHYREEYGRYLIDMGKNYGRDWPDKIITEMEKATRLFKNDGILLSILGMGYEMKGEIDKAIPIYEESVRINPYMGNTYNNLGAIYANKGDYERAAICFLKGLKGFPGDRRLFSNAKMLGLIMIEKGMIDRAERLFSNLDELCTEKDLLLLLHRELAQRYWLLKENELFVKHTERIIELNPQEFEAYRNLGLFFLEKDTERALSYLNKALEIREDENIKRVVAKYR